MNIAHLTQTYLRQSETFIWQYLRSFQATNPYIYCKHTANLEQFEVKGAKIFRYGSPKWSAPWIHNQFHRFFLGTREGAISKSLQQNDIKAMHAHFGWTGARYALLAEKLNIPLITSFYGSDASQASNLANLRSGYNKLFELGTLFLVEGPELKKKLIGIGCPESKIQVQPISIDLDKYEFRPREYPENRSIRLLFVGRLVEKKGLKYAIEAIAQAKTVRLEFNIIGSGKLQTELEKFAQEIGVADKINWMGMQSHDAVLKSLNETDLFIHPSVTASDGDSEGGAPTIILEAQACGIPVISTSHADIPNITLPGESAFLAPERDANALAAIILSLCKTPQDWTEIGKAGREFISKYHDIKKNVKLLEKRYRQLLVQ